ncbi:endolytic transglycosylase MltG [Streptococcus pluranimalium]|uniref:endolytic transglycosylase MltG n=1 Tax=Streptococcus pluranimalium TaxID=82348 RepID=UPI0024154D35|nr:endolytic transglycosylase MltG [Streptococcus pluranimalium]WFM80239.1 endolytic transglycosylase MltG [Streptococcus pluranimalium]
MTDFKDDDKSSSVGAENFKERILRELEDANRKRQLQEEEQKRAEEARQAEQARLQQEKEAARLAKEREDELARIQREQELVRQAEQARLQQEKEAARLAKEREDELARIQREQELVRQAEQARLQQEKEAARLAKEREDELARIQREKDLKHHQESAVSLSLSTEVSESSHSVSMSESTSEAFQLTDDKVLSADLKAPLLRPSQEKQSTSASLTAGEVEFSDTDIEQSHKQEAGQTHIAENNKLSSDSIAAKNEAVVAQVEAKESITEVKRPIMNRRRKNNRIAAKITGILVTIIVLIGLLTAFLGYRYVSSSLGAVDTDSKEFVTVQIPEGSGNKLIGQILEENGLVKNAAIFNYYTRFKNVSNLQSGYYNLQKSMTVKDIIDTLKQGGTLEPQEPVSGKILVTEGSTIDQIAKAVTVNVNTKKASKTSYSEQDFLELMKNKDFIDKMVKKYPELLKDIPSADQARYQLEGYLFPATYNYYEESSLEDIVDQMLATMNTNLAPYFDQIAAKGHTINEVLTLASLVEKEGSTDEDRRHIASVFYNRLNIQMPLQSNIAILYAMGKLGQETTLREDATIDTKINSPYNIYENPGLMPGPVDSPGLSAIEATINPANTDNLYFVADVTTGEVYYAEDYATHDANVSKYVNAHLENSAE